MEAENAFTTREWFTVPLEEVRHKGKDAVTAVRAEVQASS